MYPLVSILIPTYNAQEWIADTIESALAQTWPSKEIVIVDDGSKDHTFEIANRYASTAVRVAKQTNQGGAAARNTVYSLCQGDYIQWLDADDLLAPDKVERQVRRIDEVQSKRTLLSGAWAYFGYRKRKAQFTPSSLWADLTPLEWMLRKMANAYHMQTDNWLVSRELSEAAGPWNVNLWRDNDGEYFCRVILASDGIKFIPEARSYYRRAGFSSVSQIGGSNKKLESLFLSMTLHIKYLLSLEDSERTRSTCVQYIHLWLHEFYPYRLDLVEKLKTIAEQLGGTLHEPNLSWKYQWLVSLFGWRVGRQAQLMTAKVKSSVSLTWDKAMLQLEHGRERPPAG